MEDFAKVRGKVTVKKYRIPKGMDEETFVKLIDKAEVKPYDVEEKDNIWLTTGWNEILSLIAGYSSNHFDSTNTRIGVGNSSTAADASQTDLLGTSKTYVTITSGYPTTPSSGTITYKGRFGTGDANYQHYELVVKNNASSVCWNRVVLSGDTKTSSDVWDYEVTLGKA